MRIAAIVCFLLAVLARFSAVHTIAGSEGRLEQTGHMVGYTLVSLVVPVALLILGLVLWHRKSKIEPVDHGAAGHEG